MELKDALGVEIAGPHEADRRRRSPTRKQQAARSSACRAMRN